MRRKLPGGQSYFSLLALGESLGFSLDQLPVSLKILLENLLRHEDGDTVTWEDIAAVAQWPAPVAQSREVAFHPVRVLMPDSSGVPLLIDLAAMRDAMAARGLDARRVNPLLPIDMVIDHSIRLDHFGSKAAHRLNLEAELDRNRERYGVVRWAASQFDNLRVVPPGNGIVHQVNIEHLATVVATERDGDGETLAFPDSLVGMDSHTPMVNALGVFGWGVGGIEAATAMFRQPVSLTVPRIVGCRLVGTKRAGVMCADIVLTLTRFLREHDVLAAIVEFCGPGLDALSLPDRATIANMAAEYGATMGFFPVDQETLRYLDQTARSAEQVALVRDYTQAQGMWRGAEPAFPEVIEFDLGTVESSLAGPSRPEDRVSLANVANRFREVYADQIGAAPTPDVGLADRPMAHGDIVIAAINSCTNTSNPFQVVAAGLLARNAAARGLRTKPWVKTSFSPGSRTVTAMLENAGLMESLEALGFHLSGYGCMSCGSSAGALAEPILSQIRNGDLVAMGMLSSNRNFEGRLHAAVRGTFLTSPPQVVAYAIAGSVLHDLSSESLGVDPAGKPVFLEEIWPSDAEIQDCLAAVLHKDLFRQAYDTFADIGTGWSDIPFNTEPAFDWDPASLFLRRPPFVETNTGLADPIAGARMLLLLGDNITTDHISPGALIPPQTDSGRYLAAHGVAAGKFGTYISRRANHDVMIRGTFANTRLRNELVPGREGGFTRHQPSGDVMSIFAASERYRAASCPMIVVAGANYGCGSSRDWAAKGTRLLGVRIVIAESFERIHRSNLLGMGVIPLQFLPGVTRHSLQLVGDETFDIPALASALQPGTTITARFHRASGATETISLLSRVDTRREADWVRHGGILPFVLEELALAS
ncbi:aconitate hydratase AcnA [Acidisphaera sp. L21]|uniref:aconitate hydratase AcnA n=1 Tax=Acidisphaera sp. L21 TaxID=1641851 RepID=UPI0030058ED2